MAAMPPSVRRLLALVILLAPIALCWLGLFQPMISKWYGARIQIEQAYELLQKYQIINANREELKTTLEYWEEAILPRSGMFAEGNPDIVGAELQKSVSDIVKDNGGEILSIQILPSSNEHRLTRLAVRIQFKAGTEVLMSILYRLESARPYLFMGNLQISADQMDAADKLFVVGDVYGYM